MVDERTQLALVGGGALGIAALAWYFSRREPCMQLGPFQTDPEPFAMSEPVRSCDPTPKPGVVKFRAWVLRELGGRDGGISRACKTPPVSPHEEGRAWDWFPPNRATADAFISCLLGERGELARRAGLRNIIYWGRTWNAGRMAAGGDGWAPYKHAGSPDPTAAHREHVHFAFSWDGARGLTSLYTEALADDVQVQGIAELGQPTKMIAAVRTPASAEELRSALGAAHVAELGREPSVHRLRLAWAMVGHETDQTRSMWNHNVGNIACTAGFPLCHALNVRDPSREPVKYRSYSDLESGARDFWRLLADRYSDALRHFDRGDAMGAAQALKAQGYFGQDADVYGRALQRHAAVWDSTFGAPPPPRGGALGALLVLTVAGGGLAALARWGG